MKSSVVAIKPKLNKRVFSRLGIVLTCILLALFGALLMAFPNRYIPVCFEGICMWAECVLPSLFPFMVITLLLIKLGAADKAAKPFSKLSRKLKLPDYTLPLFIMGLCSGYPAGSRILCEFYEAGRLDERDCKCLAPLISACGPLFAIGTVGFKAFGDSIAGVKLFICCLISVVSTSLIYCLLQKRKTQAPTSRVVKKDDNVLYSSFTGAVNASITAGGFICFFYTLSRAAAQIKILKPLEFILSLPFGKGCAEALCTGLIEATGGCFSLASNGGFFALPLAGFLITFGGISILLQQVCYLKKCKVKTSFFAGFKLLQGIVSFALLCILNLICP